MTLLLTIIGWSGRGSGMRSQNMPYSSSPISSSGGGGRGGGARSSSGEGGRGGETEKIALFSIKNHKIWRNFQKQTKNEQKKF